MGSSEKFCLKWDDFKDNIGVSFGNLQQTEEFSNVTLTCDGDHKIEAHKIILSASSPFFNLLLRKNNHPHPLLYMRGMSTNQLSAVVDFIYHGEVNIYQEDLEDFLKLAEELQLKGLSGSETEIRPSQKSELVQSKTRNKPGHHYSEREKINESYELDGTANQIFSVQGVGASTEDTSVVNADTDLMKQETNIEDLDATIDTMMENLGPGNGYACKICGKIEPKKKDHLKNHIEAKHIQGVTHPCTKCGKSFRSRIGLTQHISKSCRMQKA